MNTVDTLAFIQELAWAGNVEALGGDLIYTIGECSLQEIQEATSTRQSGLFWIIEGGVYDGFPLIVMVSVGESILTIESISIP